MSTFSQELPRRRAERLAAGGLSGRSAFNLSGRSAYDFSESATNSAFADALNSDVGFQTYGIRDEALELAAAGVPIPVASSSSANAKIDLGVLNREVAGYFGAAYDATQIPMLQRAQQSISGGLEAFADYSIQNLPGSLQPVAGGIYAFGTAVNNVIFPTGALDVIPEVGTVVGALAKLRRADNALDLVEDTSRISRAIDEINFDEYVKGLATKENSDQYTK